MEVLWLVGVIMLMRKDIAASSWLDRKSLRPVDWSTIPETPLQGWLLPEMQLALEAPFVEMAARMRFQIWAQLATRRPSWR